MAKLGVNVDHIATLRQARYRKVKSFHPEPDPVKAGLICLKAGADSVVMHLREDRRHIQDNDIVKFCNLAGNHKLNLEMSVSLEIVKFALKIKPREATLVPEKREELTTEGGLDVVGGFDKIQKAVKKLKEKNIRVSLFIEPDKKQILAARRTGADFIELHTGEYSEAKGSDKEKLILKLSQAARLAKSLCLGVNAGHGLNYENVKPIARLKEIEELNIGHSIISRSVFVGLEQAVAEMLNLIK